MRELKILVIVVVVIGVIYWGVEPLAHSIMHPKVADANYNFAESNKADIEFLKNAVQKEQAELEAAKATNNTQAVERIQNALDKNQTNLANLEAFWGEIDLKAGNSENGKTIVTEQCLVCHTIHSQNLNRSSEQSDEDAALSYGVLPPDLSNAGAVFDHNFLAHFLKDPTLASKLWNKDGFNHPMPPYNWMDNTQIADVVAYLASIAPNQLSDKEVFEQACGRCHSVLYDHFSAQTSSENLDRYLGTKIPDLSMMIRSRGVDYLHKFINDPQKLLPGTSMPRVGVTEQAEKQIVAYLESVGDAKKEQRESLGIKIIIFFVIMAILAYLWKRKIWHELH